jgi:oligopeptide transport system substrate-binding protein
MNKQNFWALCVCFALGSCAPGKETGPLTVSVIGAPLHLADPNTSAPDAGGALLLGATAQGLVAFDAEGQVEPALAERWIVTDDGLSYIFRIRRALWAKGQPVTAAEVAARLTSALSGSSRNRLRGQLGAFTRVFSMTGQVIEIRLSVPQPNFLQLLAQPDLAIFKGNAANGSGPYQIHSSRKGVTRLRLSGDTRDEETAADVNQTDIRVRGEGASLAVARFAAQDIGLVTGGRFDDLALARAIRPANSQFQLDPAYGLFGLAVAADSKALADVNVRRALAMAIDRDRLVRLFGLQSWRPSLAILPDQLDSSAPPAALEWTGQDIIQRQERGRASIGDAAELGDIRVALPEGPGARLLFAALAADWKKIGVQARRVSMRAPADLRLIDEVAPQSGGLWYLMRLSCVRGLPCSEKGETALRAALSAKTLQERGTAIAEVDAAFASLQAYIPLALPLRWSLVSPELTGWRPSAFALHPIQHLRGAQP